MRDFLRCIAAAMVVAAFGAVSLGFGTFAAYVYLRASEGGGGAALIVCAVYGLIAITIAATWLVRRRGGRLRRAAAASASLGTVESLLQALAAAGTPKDPLVLDAAVRLGRALSPMQLVALALIGGFIAGRKPGK